MTENEKWLKPLAGHRALVAGASSGIGRATAYAYAEAGAAVAVHYRSNQDEADKIAADVRQRDGPGIGARKDTGQCHCAGRHQNGDIGKNA